jgi:hypothetical protein
VEDIDFLPAAELSEAIRQLQRPRHHGAIDKDRDDANSALQRRFDLDAHKIVGVIEPTPIFRIRARKPISTDDRNQRVASSDALG